MKKIRMGLVAGAAAMLAVAPVAPAAAADASADNCFIHTDDWVRCACIPVAALLTKVTGEQWQCA